MPRWSPFEPYFWSLVDMTGECWLWLGVPGTDGYGRIVYKGRRSHAHRIAWILRYGEIPTHILICHHCDVKLCVRLEHLFAGSQTENMQDWTRKGKNKAINLGTLTKRGNEHWTRQPEAQQWRERQSMKLSEELKTGKRILVRGLYGRILGTRMASK